MDSSASGGGPSMADFLSSAAASAVPSSGGDAFDLLDMQSLSEVFRCFICMENVRDARLCPYCSKFCCFLCIRRWIVEQRAHCPHCRRSLRVNDLVRCNWADDLILRLDMMQRNRQAHMAGSTSSRIHSSNTVADSPRTSASSCEDLCVVHEEKLSVYCSSCQVCICHHCALWENQHSGHTIKPLKEEYESRVRCVTDEIEKIRSYLCQLIGTLQELERNIETIKQTKEERVREVRCAVELIVARLDSQMKNKLISLTGQKRALSMEVEMMESVVHNVEHQLRVNSRARLLQVVPELLSSLSGIQRTPQMPALPITADFVSEVVPPFESQTFVMRGFSELRSCSQPLYSPPLHVNALTWRLKVYPVGQRRNGNGAVRGNYLSVFIELSQGPPESMSYDYRVSLLHQTSGDAARSVVREFSNDFEVGECWGYNRFYKISALSTEGFIDPAVDSLALEFHVRSPNYYQKCKELNWFAQQLAASNQEKSRELQTLRAELTAYKQQEPQLQPSGSPHSHTASDSPDQNMAERETAAGSTTKAESVASSTDVERLDRASYSPISTAATRNSWFSDGQFLQSGYPTDYYRAEEEEELRAAMACLASLRSTSPLTGGASASCSAATDNILIPDTQSAAGSSGNELSDASSIGHMLHRARSTDGNEKDVEMELAQQRLRDTCTLSFPTALFDSVPQREAQQQQQQSRRPPPAQPTRPAAAANPAVSSAAATMSAGGDVEDELVGSWDAIPGAQTTTLDRIRHAFRMGVQNSQHIDFNLADSGSSTSSQPPGSALVLVGAEIHTPGASNVCGRGGHECHESLHCCSHGTPLASHIRSRHNNSSVQVGSPIVSSSATSASVPEQHRGISRDREHRQ